jgi:hypothetical protein
MNESPSKTVELLADLNTIGDGAAVEKFEHALQAVLRNIRDPNTTPKAKRKVVIEFVFVPTEDRERAAVLIDARTVLASNRPTMSDVFIGRSKDGAEVATVLHRPSPGTDPRQGVIDFPAKREGAK